ncbi:MAG: hypothetical protein ABSG94_04450 [Brevinematales bacterium]|jgi:hypothetical protein
MKKSALIAVFFILFSIYTSLFCQQDRSAADFFKDVRMASIDALPDKFSAGLSGQSIEKKLSSIPKDSYLDKSKNVTAMVIYSKTKGITITVVNVDDLYRDIYKDLPRQFFAFDILLSERTTDSFLNKYEVSYYGKGPEGADPVILKLRIRGAENNVLLFVDRATLQIRRIDYLLGENLMSTTQVIYNDYDQGGKTYSIPCRFLSKIGTGGGNSGRSDVFEMVNVALGGR